MNDERKELQSISGKLMSFSSTLASTPDTITMDDLNKAGILRLVEIIQKREERQQATLK